MSTQQSPKELWQNLPIKPGVYLFKDTVGEILYVGKAINLKKRVSSYFLGNLNDRPWTKVMQPLIDEVETIVVTNEVEALMLEATLIKQHLPRFNIKLTDDKSYPYIRLSADEPIARFSITRKLTKDGSIYFGPYLSARSAKHTLEFLRNVYGIHISNSRLTAGKQRPCMDCQLSGFTCPLADEVDEEAYNMRIQGASEFLRGKRRRLLDDLEEQMSIAAEKEQYELAAKLRDRLHGTKQIFNRQQVISSSQDDYDTIGIAVSSALAAVAILQVREGRVNGQKNFFFDLVGEEDPSEIVRSFLVNIYQNMTDIPGLLVLPNVISDQEVIEELLSSIAGHGVTLRVAKRGDKWRLLDLASRNAQSKLESKLLKSDHAFVGTIALTDLLKLRATPNRIEAVDISNLGTSEPVGATVCFIDGQPDKNEYRRYRINTVEGQNDFAMIKEVVTRRFSDTTRPVPDLFVVDGGIEQLNFALKALEDTPTRPSYIISLAKKPDRIFIPGRKLPVAATRGHKGVMLLSRIRDEVHRFAIGFQRKRQSKKSLASEN